MNLAAVLESREHVVVVLKLQTGHNVTLQRKETAILRRSV